MHNLDKYIEDIVPRLDDIINHAYNSEGTTLQTSLAAYGWILLDSWITWRTTRFLLKNAYVDDSKEKWIQTPASYTQGQLIAAWNFTEATQRYLASETGKTSYKALVEGTIIAKRNACAHSNGKVQVQGTDISDIDKIFTTFSTVFLAYEISSFIKSIEVYFLKAGYCDFNTYLNGDIIKDNIMENLDKYSKADKILITCSDSTSCQCELLIDQDRCLARKKTDDTSAYKEVSNNVINQYIFWKNKGYYFGVGLFCDTVIQCWNP